MLPISHVELFNYLRTSRKCSLSRIHQIALGWEMDPGSLLIITVSPILPSFLSPGFPSSYPLSAFASLREPSFALTQNPKPKTVFNALPLLSSQHLPFRLPTPDLCLFCFSFDVYPPSAAPEATRVRCWTFDVRCSSFSCSSHPLIF